MKKHLTRVRSALIALLVSFGSVCAFASSAHAAPFNDAVALSTEAMTLYDDFELEDAEVKIREAVEIIEANKITDPSVANIYVAQGVIGYGRLKDSAPAIAEDRAYAAFLKAVSLKKTVEIPGDYRSPELDEILERAKNDMQSGSLPVIAGVAPKPALDHTAITASGRCSALPVVVVANESEKISSMTLYYQSDDESSYNSVVMDRDPANVRSFKGVIPGVATRGSQVRYYIEARNNENATVGTVGSSNRPYAAVLTGACENLTDEDIVALYGDPLFQFNVNVGTGIAILRKGMSLQRNPNAFNPSNYDTVSKSGAAITPFFIRASGVFNLPYNMQLGIYLRGQVVNIFDGTEKYITQDGGNKAFPSLMIGATFRYLAIARQPYRLYVGVEFGWGGANASVPKNDGKVGLVLIDGKLHIAPQIGFLWTFHKNVGLNVELTVPIHFVNAEYETAHFDLSVGPYFQF